MSAANALKCRGRTRSDCQAFHFVPVVPHVSTCVIVTQSRTCINNEALTQPEGCLEQKFSFRRSIPAKSRASALIASGNSKHAATIDRLYFLLLPAPPRYIFTLPFTGTKAR